jgi:hypothetical protein
MVKEGGAPCAAGGLVQAWRWVGQCSTLYNVDRNLSIHTVYLNTYMSNYTDGTREGRFTKYYIRGFKKDS